MQFNHTEVWGFEHAIRGMRNPLESWSKSDTTIIGTDAYIGPNDMKLMKNLIKAGTADSKFLRQIFVSVDITAPMYWFSEFDTYKVGTVANSTSKMHKLASNCISIDCFEADDLRLEAIDDLNIAVSDTATMCASDVICAYMEMLEALRLRYNETKDKRYWKELVRWLPESWLQTRTVTFSYANLANMVKQRKNHKLNEWSGKDDPSLTNFIGWARTLPYAKELIFQEEDDNEAEST